MTGNLLFIFIIDILNVPVLKFYCIALNIFLPARAEEVFYSIKLLCYTLIIPVLQTVEEFTKKNERKLVPEVIFSMYLKTDIGFKICTVN